jgi:hypothetical protein
MIVQEIREARKYYLKRDLPLPSLVVSVLDEILDGYSLRNITPTFLGMRVLVDTNRLAGWELREDFGNR